MKSINQVSIVRAAIVGFIIGVAASGSYVALGGATFLYVPAWARILFYPGFWAGELAYGLLGIDEVVPEIIGCTTVGAEYALISVVLFLVGRQVIRFRRKSRMTGVKAGGESSIVDER